MGDIGDEFLEYEKVNGIEFTFRGEYIWGFYDAKLNRVVTFARRGYLPEKLEELEIEVSDYLRFHRRKV
jgi:hypothetical protein